MEEWATLIQEDGDYITASVLRRLMPLEYEKSDREVLQFGQKEQLSKQMIEKRYHQLALTTHPDKIPGQKDASKNMQRLTSAATALKAKLKGV